jgi:hypothetical protein
LSKIRYQEAIYYKTRGVTAADRGLADLFAESRHLIERSLMRQTHTRIGEDDTVAHNDVKEAWLGVPFIRICDPISYHARTEDVWSVLMTSTSFMIWTGLKKCKPTNLSGRPDATAMDVMARDDVFEAKMALGLINGPSVL